MKRETAPHPPTHPDDEADLGEQIRVASRSVQAGRQQLLAAPAEAREGLEQQLAAEEGRLRALQRAQVRTALDRLGGPGTAKGVVDGAVDVAHAAEVLAKALEAYRARFAQAQERVFKAGPTETAAAGVLAALTPTRLAEHVAARWAGQGVEFPRAPKPVGPDWLVEFLAKLSAPDTRAQ